MYKTIQEIKQANADIDQNYFSESTMEFFNCQVYDKVYDGDLFITSEQCDFGAWDGERRYSVRQCVDGRVRDVSEFGEFATFEEADLFARSFFDIEEEVQ